MFIFVLLIAAVLSASVAAQSKSSIEGVWSITEVTTTGPEASTNRSPQPGMYLFTKKHYSIIYVASAAPRAVLTDIEKATAAELRNVFVDSFIANAGTYELTAGNLTIHPMVAKSPSFMQPGTTGTYSAKISGNTMTLVTAGDNPTTFKFNRVE